MKMREIRKVERKVWKTRRKFKKFKNSQEDVHEDLQQGEKLEKF